MADLGLALPFILRHEGGWSDDPDDPGGATNYGITLATAQRHGIRTKDELRDITPEQVEEIYRQDYWRFNGLVNQRVATKLFDLAVNLGLASASRMAQEVLNDLGADLSEDGHWGPHTEAALNVAPSERLLDHLCREAADYYQALAAHRPTSEKFLRGWLARAADLPREARP